MYCIAGCVRPDYARAIDSDSGEVLIIRLAVAAELLP